MGDDARFEDGDAPRSPRSGPRSTAASAPVSLRALEAEDVPVISALVQDAVFPITEMRYDRARRHFALLLNRFRWEQGDRAASAPERVQSVLVVADALAVRTQGLDRGDTDTILSLLALNWIPGDDGTGRVELVLAGDGAIAVEVEALELTLRDVTQPYRAPSGKTPDHGA